MQQASYLERGPLHVTEISDDDEDDDDASNKYPQHTFS